MQRELPPPTSNNGRYGSWSPDGTKIVYCSYSSAGNTVEIIDLISNEVTIIAYGPWLVPQWSPNGKYVLCHSAAPAKEIIRIDVETLETIQLAGRGAPIDPYAWEQAKYKISWHPNSESFIFFANGPEVGGDPFGVHWATKDGEGFKLLVEGWYHGIYKDANTLILSERAEDIKSEFENPSNWAGERYWLVDANTGKLLEAILDVDPILERDSGSYNFDYSASTGMLVFYSNNIYMVDINGPNFYPLVEDQSTHPTDPPNYHTLSNPRFSPNGKKIVFTASGYNRNFEWTNLFIYDIHTQTINRVTPDEITYSDRSLPLPK